MFNLRSLDLNLLTVFEAIYELGTVSRAADRLALSQSATSHALSRLRKACGDDLFVRSGVGLAPTPAANAMYPTISQALKTLRESLAEAGGFDPTRSQRHFRLSIPHPMGPFYALDLKAVAAAVAPGVELAFDTISRPISLDDSLREGATDIAIDWLPIELDQFVNQKLFEDRVMLVARRGHPSVGLGITTEGLRKEQFVAPHRRRNHEYMPYALREIDRLDLPEVVRVSEILEIATVVASTDLLGIMLLSMGPLMEKQLGLQILRFPLELPALPIYMIWHKRRCNDAAHRWLRELVVAEVGRSAEHLHAVPIS